MKFTGTTHPSTDPHLRKLAHQLVDGVQLLTFDSIPDLHLQLVGDLDNDGRPRDFVVTSNEDRVEVHVYGVLLASFIPIPA